jgi:cellulose synthase/poly-beta-1,6-N-acetylglucosamine synthase-like glycosyltransferase
MSFLDYLVISLYTFALLFIFFFALSEFLLMRKYLRYKKTKGKNTANPNYFQQSYPTVTIQLPIYNELYVVDKLLDNIAEIDYPHEALQIQVLDDSTDETYDLVSKKVRELQKKGLPIQQIHRTNRTGFKAGALKEGLEIAKGDYIVIFDADFLPDAAWLKQTLPYFSADNIGAVQTKWGHLNRDYSFLTKVQAFALDIHFTMEQVGRYAGGHFINFNGTAGIWRKDCILDAGNWRALSLTEDLDLSYRAQLKGWKMVYLEQVETPAELPVDITAAKSQQFRWNKGGAENLRLHLYDLMNNKTLSLKTRLFGLFHLLSSSVFVFVLLLAVLSVAMLHIKMSHPELQNYFIVSSSFIVSTLLLFYSYWYVFTEGKSHSPRLFLHYIKEFFSFFTIALGFSLHNSIAVVEGWIGKKSPFVRTPKFNVAAAKVNWRKNKYLAKKIKFSVWLEGVLALYFAYGIYAAFTSGSAIDLGLVPLHLMLLIGYSLVFAKTIQSRLLN